VKDVASSQILTDRNFNFYTLAIAFLKNTR
jgi:hypothetical protein